MAPTSSYNIGASSSAPLIRTRASHGEQGVPHGIAALLQKAGAPALFTALLLCTGYGVAVAIGDQSLAPPASLALIVLFGLGLAATTRRVVPPPPTLNDRAALVLRAASIASICMELAYFGIPLLGSVPYNEFGWPVVHHFAVAHWLLVLFGRKHKLLDLGLSLCIAVLLFNRQMALFSLFAYLMTTRLSARKVAAACVSAICFVSLVGVLRNQVFSIDTTYASDLPYSESLFFVYLYLTGPLVSGLVLSSDFFDTQLSAFWNTIPEWALLSAHLGMPPALSFSIFFGGVGATSYFLRQSRIWVARCMGTLIHIYSYFCFFSGVLFGTPIIASFLIAVTAAMCYPSSRKPRGKP